MELTETIKKAFISLLKLRITAQMCKDAKYTQTHINVLRFKCRMGIFPSADKMEIMLWQFGFRSKIENNKIVWYKKELK